MIKVREWFSQGQADYPENDDPFILNLKKAGISQ